MREHFERLFHHMAWADLRVLRLLNESPGARRHAAVRLFSHLLAAERVWLLRVHGRDTAGQPIWPELSLVELNAMAAANGFGYNRLLAGLDEAGLAREVEYTNSQGVPFRTRVADVLSHVALHGSYHRGQIAAALRAAGEEPVNTDFITFVREGAPSGALAGAAG
jgi:uncharacterized damage-inducible protein DinB